MVTRPPAQNLGQNAASNAGADKPRHGGHRGATAAPYVLPSDEIIKADVRNLSFHYGAHAALHDVSFKLARHRVTAMIGPSGCGKSTLLRCFNRMHDLYPNTRYEGEIILQPDNINIIGGDMEPMEARMRMGMVFQKPNPFPKSIFENVAFGLRIRGERRHGFIEEKVEQSLRGAGLWEETKDRLGHSGTALSGGQQQRLCIARALASDPEILLFDEPTSSLDPASTHRIEDLMAELKPRVTILIVTHNMQQASRVSDYTAFMYLGKLVEFNNTTTMFTTPTDKLTEQYITGRFG